MRLADVLNNWTPAKKREKRPRVREERQRRELCQCGACQRCNTRRKTREYRQRREAASQVRVYADLPLYLPRGYISSLDPRLILRFAIRRRWETLPLSDMSQPFHFDLGGLRP